LRSIQRELYVFVNDRVDKLLAIRRDHSCSPPAVGLPSFLGGAVDLVYDLGLYAGFKANKAEHELT